MALTDFFLRMFVALLLGSCIGFERQLRLRVAGLRTNALVSVGSALFASLALLMTHDSSPTRMAAQIVSGIGFLGAGLILREGTNVKGLNTAATLWCTAAVGTLAGSGFLAEATVGAFMIIAAHLILRPLAVKIATHRVTPAEMETVYHIKIICQTQVEQHIRAFMIQDILLHSGWTLKSIRREQLKPVGDIELLADVVTQVRDDKHLEQLVTRLGIEDGVTTVSWEVSEAPMEIE